VPAVTTATSALTAERVKAAYSALSTGDRAAIAEYWDPGITWVTAGESKVSGTYKGLDSFMGFLQTMGELTGGSLQAEISVLLVSGDEAVLITHNTATRATDPGRRLDIEEVQYVRCQAGRIVAGKGAMFGSGTAEFDRFVA
jgi:ketosteroid isomerase-like protein